MTRTRLIVSLALGYVGLAAVRDLRESEAAFANEWAVDAFVGRIQRERMGATLRRVAEDGD